MKNRHAYHSPILLHCGRLSAYLVVYFHFQNTLQLTKLALTLPLIGANKAKMSEELDLQHLIQNADQLFDENQYQDAYDLLKKFPVRLIK